MNGNTETRHKKASELARKQKIKMTTIHEVEPRETAGREMIGRVRLQFQAAAFAALEILERTGVDRVYCDYHDDFVVRRIDGSQPSYLFFQVKTKGKANHQWTMNEVFSIKKKSLAIDEDSLNKVGDSFAGKLFLHTINFDGACITVTLLTNVHFADDVEALVAELRSGEFESAPAKFLADRFCEIFKPTEQLSAAKVAANLGKFRLAAGAKHITGTQADFVDAARGAIYRFSEIDLEYEEVKTISSNLLSLVAKKSSEKYLAGITAAELDETVSVGLEDLLPILSISSDVYDAMVAGEDPAALKNASILQRKLEAAGASATLVEFASRKKVEWDLWLRNARHSVPEGDLVLYLEKVGAANNKWLNSGGAVSDLDSYVNDLMAAAIQSNIYTLTRDLLLGGIFAALVRSKAK